ncbi:MAG: hypothetical protein LBQ40_00465 [Clostridiales bacterium]|jgi:SOS regulatory protein LexA|nr:hypothetical protein [Clostridiales bacterium]
MEEKDKKIIDRVLNVIDTSGTNSYALEKSGIIKNASTVIAQWRKYRQKPSTDAIVKIAKYFNVTTDYLLGHPDMPRPKTEDELEAELMERIGAIPMDELNQHPIPVVGIAAAGNPIWAVEDIDEYIFINFPNPDEYFAVRVRGDSMIGAGIADGSIVVIHRQSDADSGQIVLATIDNEATIKRFKRTTQGVFMLKPENDKYDPIIVDKKCDFRILGIVKEIRIKV